MKLKNIQHIFFDLDHTLWDFDKNSALTFENILKEERVEIELDKFLESYLPINNNYWKLYRENKISKEALRTGRLRDCFTALEMEVPSETIEILSSNYIKVLPRFNHLLEDAIVTLQYLKPRYQLHIITNGFEEVQHLKLKNSMIAEYFSTVTTSEEVGVKKPHPDIFNKAFEKSGAVSSGSLMIGDNYEADILGAENVGMRSIYFNYYKSREIIQVPAIQKLKELKKYL